VRRSTPLVVSILVAVTAGCGSADEDTTPAACLKGPAAFTSALESAPKAVRLDGNVAISDCLVHNQSAGDLANVGSTLVKVTTDLNAAARQDPGGAPTVQLGYLAGSIARGAAETQGIHAELLRRIEAAALYSPAGKPPPEPFDHAYEKGYAAGRDDG
jgi:hypothetical protein